MKIKLVIWDLDDTLWAGTLAEGDQVVLHEVRARFLRSLNNHGIVSAICSKNDGLLAKQKMVEFDLWDHTVFNRIAFAPKGAAVQQIIEDMQLRAENVLFVDDNVLNLQEVKHFCSEINVVDATSKECDLVLERILQDNAHIEKSRVQQYRDLEQKFLDRQSSALSNEDFLRSCGIKVSIARLTDNFDHALRIEELINRTNQLNFTKSRVKEGEVIKLLSGHYRAFQAYSLFAWDNYGYHGLVGFAAVKYDSELLHFLFSCRMMNSGLEEWFLDRLKKRHPKLEHAHIPVRAVSNDWIVFKEYNGEIRDWIRSKELKVGLQEPKIRVMADCQSGSIVHYAGLSDVAEADLYPRAFALSSLHKQPNLTGPAPKHLVYFTAVDYSDARAPQKKWDDEVYSECAANFAEMVRLGAHKAMIIIPPEVAKKYNVILGIDEARVKKYNGIWRDLCSTHRNMELFDLQVEGEVEDIIDVRHFRISLLEKIGLCVGKWFAQVDELLTLVAE